MSMGKGHLVAMPYPSRGHVNPMMNLCKFLASRTSNEDVVITFVVTQEWLGFIGSDPKPHSVRFASIPNVIPLESQITADIPGFFEAAVTKMRAPFEQLLDQLEPPATAILADVELGWPTDVAKRRNIPVALLWTMSASFFSILHQLDILAPNRLLPVDLLDEQAEHIAGISSSQLTDLRNLLHGSDPKFLKIALECISEVAKTDYLLLNTIQELEAEPINSLKAIFPCRLYPIGPAIPFMELEPPNESPTTNPEYIMNWLDSQPNMSVLYISLGSFLSASSTQMEELASALKTSHIRFLWVCRSEASGLKEKCGDKGLVVPWCDQLMVLSHRSIVGFWSHCGWNSTLEACFAGVPILAFPLFLDQASNCRHIVQEWKNGWKVISKRSEFSSQDFVTKEEISEALRMVMDLERKEGKEIRERARDIRGMCRRAIAKGGSSDKNLDAFVEDILGVQGRLEN